MENLMISANAVLPMCLVMALGYGTRRLGWLRRDLHHQQDRFPYFSAMFALL